MAQFNSGYSSSEILSMQRDAAERVREMQRRAREKLNQSNGNRRDNSNHFGTRQTSLSLHDGGAKGEISGISFQPPQRTPQCHQTALQPTSFSQSFLGNSIQGILTQFHLDQDRILLLLLFLVLMQEEVDPMLLLALAYIFF